MPTSGHFIFIPAVLLIGMFIGFLLGTRVAVDRINLERKREEERAKARAERKAKRGAKEPSSAADADATADKDG